MKFRILALACAVAALSTFTACESKTELNISTVGDTMAYDVSTLEAKAGSTITLTLKNNGTNAAMQHNWILVKPGTDAEVSTAGLTAGPAKGYIPENANIIAHTKLTQPGESDTITFPAPAAGTYPYFCSFPGHSGLMKGVLKVN